MRHKKITGPKADSKDSKAVSVSKTFTAVAILQLAEKKKLSTGDTLDKYFPEYETGKNNADYFEKMFAE